jgi:hypothetical protein
LAIHFETAEIMDAALTPAYLDSRRDTSKRAAIRSHFCSSRKNSSRSSLVRALAA